MSSISRLLRRAFATSAQPSTASATATATTTTTNPGAKKLCAELNKERNLKRVVELFKKSSENERFRTKTGIYQEITRRLFTAKRFRWIEEILEDQKKYRDISREGFNARLISLYGKSGMLDNARKVFEEMPERNCPRTALSFNALLAACVNSKNFDMVEKLFRELAGKLKIEPDLISYNILVKAFCEMGSFDSAVSVLDEMEKKGLEPDIYTFATLSKGFYENGRFLDGEKIWSRMVEKNVFPDVRCYNSKLLGLASEKRAKDAVELLQEMRKKGIKPDVFSFDALIKGFVIEENLAEAKYWYNEISINGCTPHKSTLVTLIPFVCEKGDFGFAFELSKDCFMRKRLVGEEVLQLVVDGLVKESKIREAEELVQLGRSNGYRRYRLKLPQLVQ